MLWSFKRLVVSIGLAFGVAQASNKAEILIEQAMQLYRTQEFRQAEERFRRALELEPANLRARIYLARTLLQADQVPLALRELQSLLDMHPGDPEAQFQAGRMLQELAERRFAKLERLAPDSAETHELLGRYQEAQRRLKEALSEYRLALQRSPAGPGLHFLVGNIHWKLRDFDAALPELEAELRVNPDHALGNQRIGNIYVERREASGALPYLEKAVRGDPNLLEAHRDLGRAFRLLERFSEALPEFQFVAQRQPEDDTVHAQLAAVYKALGQPQRAAAELEIHQRIVQKRLEATQKKFESPR